MQHTADDGHLVSIVYEDGAGTPFIFEGETIWVLFAIFFTGVSRNESDVRDPSGSSNGKSIDQTPVNQ